MEDPARQRPELVGREAELGHLRKALDAAVAGKGSTLLVSGEAGIGKSRLIEEFLAKVEKEDVKVLDGGAVSDVAHPFFIFTDALGDELEGSLFEEREHKSFVKVFAVNKAGHLVAEASSGKGEELDADVFAGMLAAVQNFVRDSFDRAGKAALGKLEYGNVKVMVEYGRSIFLAAVFQGAEHADMKRALRRAVDDIEETPGPSEGATDSPITEQVAKLADMKFLVRRDLEGMKLEEERIRIADRVLEEVDTMSKTRPLLLILEDLHWADESSLFVLNYLARNIANKKVMILGSLRPEDTPSLKAAIRGMEEERTAEMVDLGALPGMAVSTLVDQSYEPNDFPSEFVGSLAERCAGNPFFLIETLRHLADIGKIGQREGRYVLLSDDYALPGTVEDVVHRRLEVLDPETMAMAEYAACIGRRFGREAALSITMVRDASTALASLESSGIVTRTNGIAEFVHAIFQNVIYDSIGERWRSAHHKSLGEYYETAGSQDEVVYELARHFFLSREYDKAYTYCKEAGEKAEGAFAIEQAISYYDNAMSLVPNHHDAGPEEKVECLTRLGDLHALMGEYESAIARYLEAVEEESEPEAKADIHRKIAEVHLNRGDYDVSSERVRVGLGLLGGEDSIVTARLLSVLSWISMRKGDFDEAYTHLEKALVIAENCNDLKEIASVKHNIGSIYLQKGDNPGAIKYLEESYKIREDIGDVGKLASSLNNLGNLYYSMGELEKSRESYEKAIEHTIRIGDKRGHSLVLTNVGSLYGSLGDLDRSMECFKESYELKRKFGDKWGISTVLENIGTIHLERKEFDLALGYYDRVIKIREEIGDKAGVALTLLNQGELYYYTGDYEKAIDHLLKAQDICGDIKQHWIMAIIKYRIAETHLALGDLDEALRYTNTALELSDKSGAKSNQAKCRQVLGRILTASGQLDDAFAEFEKAKQLYEETKEIGETGKLFYDMSFYYVAKGEPEKARELLEEALVIFGPMSLILWSDKCEDALNDLK